MTLKELQYSKADSIKSMVKILTSNKDIYMYALVPTMAMFMFGINSGCVYLTMLNS